MAAWLADGSPPSHGGNNPANTGNSIAEAPPTDKVEADTAAKEDVVDLNAVLLPNGSFPLNYCTQAAHNVEQRAVLPLATTHGYLLSTLCVVPSQVCRVLLRCRLPGLGEAALSSVRRSFVGRGLEHCQQLSAPSCTGLGPRPHSRGLQRADAGQN